MADTIVNTPERSSDAAGWVVAIIILLAVIAGGVYFFTRANAPAPEQPGTNINVTLPTGSGQEGGAAQ